MISFLKRRDKNIPTNQAPTIELQNPDPNHDTRNASELSQQLKRTRTSLLGGIANLFRGKKPIDTKLLENLEAKLLVADVGVAATKQILDELVTQSKKQQDFDADSLLQLLQTQLENIITPCSKPLVIPENLRPFVILFIGVNGSGKTTTIGKLAKQIQNTGKSVILAAGDTFRAAAIDQLKVWGERNQIPVIAQQPGADSAAVIFDAIQAAKSRNIDVVIADTAGRLHTQTNLMEELKKIKRIIQKVEPTAPHEVILVLDATTGQNALNQAQQFHNALNITGLCITKLDGSAKGGMIFAIAKQLHLPIRFIGIGETINDLKTFNAKEFVGALFNYD